MYHSLIPDNQSSDPVGELSHSNFYFSSHLGAYYQLQEIFLKDFKLFNPNFLKPSHQTNISARYAQVSEIIREKGVWRRGH